MILVRDVIHLKAGQMNTVLPALKEALAAGRQSQLSRVLTDISGRHFTLVIETKAESMDAYWQQLQASFETQDAEQSAAFAELTEYGYREFFTIEYEA